MALEQSFRLVKMDTPDPNATLTPLAVTVSRPERLSPKLTPAQLARIAAHGQPPTAATALRSSCPTSCNVARRPTG